VDLLVGLAGWFTDPENWSGRDAIPLRLAEHVGISAVALVVAVAVALPVALYIGHTGRGGFLAVSLANVGRAVPSYALLVILFGFFVQVSSDIGVVTNGPTVLAMIALAIPPIVTNTYVALRDVDRDLVEAAHGMGMRGTDVLRQVELPLAMPVILAGLRTASVQVVATAALGAVIGGGGLGRYIIQGIARFDEPRLLAGALMVALLAIATELSFGWIQRRVISPGMGAQAGGGYGQPAETRVPLPPGVPAN
jgi:osmoprotectant transport system permease protein